MIITPCVKEKLAWSAPLPACLRYKSGSIKRLTLRSLTSGEPFYILSGRYGLISPWKLIHDYDQLLDANDWECWVASIAKVLELMPGEKVSFHWDYKDKYSWTYYRIIDKACVRLGRPFVSKPLNSS